LAIGASVTELVAISTGKIAKDQSSRLAVGLAYLWIAVFLAIVVYVFMTARS